MMMQRAESMAHSGIQVSKHAAEQFVKKFNPPIDTNYRGGNGTLQTAKYIVSLLYASAVKVKANDKGTLYRNYIIKADIIVNNNVVCTIFPLRKPLKRGGYAKRI